MTGALNQRLRLLGHATRCQLVAKDHGVISPLGSQELVVLFVLLLQSLDDVRVLQLLLGELLTCSARAREWQVKRTRSS